MGCAKQTLHINYDLPYGDHLIGTIYCSAIFLMTYGRMPPLS
uniref:Uncharacterized protein n=1 Tax=Arundo donax TaxID=35708 RepID=A0A0A9FZ72_ARUDO